MNVGIIGLGNQGKIIKKEIEKLGWDITTFDICGADRCLDVTDPAFKDVLDFQCPAVDLWICALPSPIAYPVQKYLATTGKKVIDISFNDFDQRELDHISKEHHTTYIPDVGLAPGLPNLIIGDQLRRHKKLDYVRIFVGGISMDPSVPFGYHITWDPYGLESEYITPAKIIAHNEVKTVTPMESVAGYTSELDRCSACLIALTTL